MIEWAHQMIDQLTGLVQAGVVLLAIVIIVSVYGRTKQLVATFVAALLAGGVVWSVHNIDWFKDKVGDETISDVSAADHADLAQGEPGDMLAHGLVGEAARRG